MKSEYFYQIYIKPRTGASPPDENPQVSETAMIICHCTQISDHDIRAAISWMRTSDPQTIITPGKIYRALGKAADCGGCMPLFLDTMRKDAKFEVPAQLQNLRRGQGEETYYEGRPKGHRISQQSAQK